MKEQKLWKDIINVILGAGILLLILYFIFHPQNIRCLFLALCLGGGINIMNGILFVRNGERVKGIAFLTAGFVIAILGFINL